MKIARLNDGPEIFFSIQGEGRTLGRPSVFVRSSLCNLHCVWCDTDYTWNWQGTSFRHQRDTQPGYRKYDKDRQIIDLSTDEVAETIRAFPCTNVVMTGGEPLLHQDDWIEVMRNLRGQDSDFWFEVETNGTLRPTDEFDSLVNQYNVSPKLANSGMERHLREKSKALKFFAAGTKSTFKFVVSDRQDLQEVQTLLDAYQVPLTVVYLMPEGTGSAELRERIGWLAEECKRYGYNLTDRLHIQLWGDRRGV